LYLFLKKKQRMPVFEESGLQFGFDSRWTVRKYDAHRFFQGFSGAGLKGVDFIALSGDTLLLLEVKNYRRRRSWQTENPFDRILEAPEAFAGHMAGKFLDTLRALRAIGTYYRRKWLFRLLRPILLRRSGAYSDWVFWAQVDTHLQGRQPVIAVLWLETERDQAAFREQLKLSLKNLLEDAVQEVQVCHLGTGQLPEGIQVRLAPK
jgi:hypothetical protein